MLPASIRLAHAAPSRRKTHVAWALAALGLLAAGGCASLEERVVDAFPPAHAAEPWILSGAVWSGSFADAAPSLGADTALWARHQPTHVWIAVYTHEKHPDRKLTVRCFEFANKGVAAEAYADARPSDARPLAIGEDGCWSAVSTTLKWDRFVADVFGDDSAWGTEVQTPALATQFAKRLAHNVGNAP